MTNKVDLKSVENRPDRYQPPMRGEKIYYLTTTERDALCKLARAAKLLFDLCEYDYGMDKTELTMLREALSQFDFGSEDE